MALIEASLRRPLAILRMPEAMARGLNVTGFIKELKALGMTYRRPQMLADWRYVGNIKQVRDSYKSIRRDYKPSDRNLIGVDWEMHHKFMYKFELNAEERTRLGLKPIGINIMSDERLTIQEAESQISIVSSGSPRFQDIHISAVRLKAIYTTSIKPSEPTPSPFIPVQTRWEELTI
jgi:hypothetical protein